MRKITVKRIPPMLDRYLMEEPEPEPEPEQPPPVPEQSSSPSIPSILMERPQTPSLAEPVSEAEAEAGITFVLPAVPAKMAAEAKKKGACSRGGGREDTDAPAAEKTTGEVKKKSACGRREESEEETDTSLNNNIPATARILAKAGKTDEFCIKTDEFCIKHDAFFIKHDEFCI